MVSFLLGFILAAVIDLILVLLLRRKIVAALQRIDRTDDVGAIALVGLVFYSMLAVAAAMLPLGADAAGRVYLESERDLGNGYKHCIYSDGVVITIQSHQLCPLSIEVK